MRKNSPGLGGVCVLGVLETGDSARILLVRKPNRAIGPEMLELPAGGIEPGESPEAASARRLAEETGYRAATLTPLARFHTAPGEIAEPMHAFLAGGLTLAGGVSSTDEGLLAVQWRLGETLAAVDDGRFTDAKTMLTLLLARRRGLI